MVTIRQILAVGMLLLLAGSHRLWTPQSLYPRVPLFEALNRVTPAIESTVTWCSLVIMVVCCLMLALPETKRKGLHSFHPLWITGLILALVAQCCFDQHRLQPWAIHISLCLLLLDHRQEQRSLDALFYLTASIYIYSAVSKLDVQFLHTVGQDFLRALGQLVALDTSRWPEAWRVGLAMLFPIGELACGVGLIFRTTRMPMTIVAVLMHLTLIAILGPWGLNHSWGVLLWNALFIALNVRMALNVTMALNPRMINYRGTAEVVDDADGSRGQFALEKTTRSPLTRVILCLAFLVPLGERWGWTDHWLGWALYAPHSSRAIVRVPEQAIERLTITLRKFVGPPEVDQLGWCELHLDNWSLATLGVPIYPQERFYVAVAEAATRGLEEFEVQTTLLGVADRWTGRRSSRALSRRSELVEQTQRYRINAVANQTHHEKASDDPY